MKTDYEEAVSGAATRKLRVATSGLNLKNGKSWMADSIASEDVLNSSMLVYVRVRHALQHSAVFTLTRCVPSIEQATSLVVARLTDRSAQCNV